MLSTPEKPKRVGDHGEEPWVRYLSLAMKVDYVRFHLGTIIRNLLRKACWGDPEITALHINEYYRDRYPVAGKDKSDFLCILYRLVFGVAKVIPPQDPRQSSLVQLVVELRKLSCRIGNESSLVYTKEPAFELQVEHFWRSYHPSRASVNSQERGYECKFWINLSAFLARCIQSRLIDWTDDGCGFAVNDISKGLEEEHRFGAMQECFVTVAIQYILMAGPEIYKELVEKPRAGSEIQEWGLRRWNLWAAKLMEIGIGDGSNSELGFEALKAHAKMSRLHSSPRATAIAPPTP